MERGCQPASPPANIAVPANPSLQTYGYPADYPKPLPDQRSEAEPPAPAFNDPPLVDLRLPEESWFVKSYNDVGPAQDRGVRESHPARRSDRGDMMCAINSTDTVRRSTGSVEVSQSQHSGSSDYYGGQRQGSSQSFKSNGPAGIPRNHHHLAASGPIR